MLVCVCITMCAFCAQRTARHFARVMTYETYQTGFQSPTWRTKMVKCTEIIQYVILVFYHSGHTQSHIMQQCWNISEIFLGKFIRFTRIENFCFKLFTKETVKKHYLKIVGLGWVALLQSNRMFSCEQHCSIVPQYCSSDRQIALSNLEPTQSRTQSNACARARMALALGKLNFSCAVIGLTFINRACRQRTETPKFRGSGCQFP
jgi:hypothetical protein